MPDSMKPFHVLTTDDGWKVTGDIDVSTSRALSEAFGVEHAAVTDGKVVVDVEEVTFIDSSGLRVLIDLLHRVGPGGVTLRAVPRSVRRLLELTGLSATFLVEDTATD